MSVANRVVLCDDDALVRSVVRHMMEDVGYVVVAEVDTAEEVLAAVEDPGWDVLVLDLALREGHGDHLLPHLVDAGIACVVFSAFVGNPMKLLDAGAVAVIEKPDFPTLEATVRDMLEQSQGEMPRRRREARDASQLPPATGLSISGFEPWSSFVAATAVLSPGDAVLGVDIVADRGVRDVWDDVYRCDYRIALGRAAMATKRTADRVSLAPGGQPVVLIVGGHPEASGALFDRIVRQWGVEVASGIPVGAFGHVTDVVGPTVLLDRILAALAAGEATPDQQLRMV